ncbi:MAG TPA: hypothetical protein VNV65_09380 [Candidatus Solibacter sp.]|jgi:hypothetical protein|nr:hypothetical protein [Candidatus Solibacter sp.]
MIPSLRPLLALSAAAMLGMSGCSSSLSTTNRTLIDFDSNISSQTNNFQTPGKWDVLYSWDCSQVRSQGNLGASGFKFVVYNSDDGSTIAEDNPSVVRTGKSGQGTAHFHLAGFYNIKITSTCKYRIRVLNEA